MAFGILGGFPGFAALTQQVRKLADVVVEFFGREVVLHAYYFLPALLLAQVLFYLAYVYHARRGVYWRFLAFFFFVLFCFTFVFFTCYGIFYVCYNIVIFEG